MSLNSLQLRHIRSFLAVAERLSFIEAATQLGVSQPALSQTINQFEETLGVRLFERTTRNVTLTEEGRRLVQHSTALDRELKRYFHELKLIRDSAGTGLRVGYLIGTGVQFLPEAIRLMEEAHPDQTIELVEYDFNRPDVGLRNAEVDCAVLRPPIDPIEGIAVEPVLQERCVVCLPVGHPLAAQDSLTLAQISNAPVIAAPGTGVWRDYWLARDHLAEAPLNVVFEAATLDSELQAVAMRKGISITAESTAKYYSRPGVCFRPLTDMRECTIAIGYHTRGKPRVNEFRAICRRVAAQLAAAKAADN